MKKTRILKNSVVCYLCRDIIVSRHVHDFVTCTCEAVSTDGGSYYQSISFKYPDQFAILSVRDDGKHLTRRENMSWGSNLTKEGKKLDKTWWREIKNLDIDHLYNILITCKVDVLWEEAIVDEIIYRENLAYQLVGLEPINEVFL